MGFAQHIDYQIGGTTTIGAAGYTAGSGSVVVVNASALLGGLTPTAQHPLRITMASATFPTLYSCNYSCTGVSGNTLAIAVLSGTDQNFGAGDNVFASIYAEDLNDLQNALSTSIATAAAESTLPASRRIVGGTNVTITDGGPGSTLTIAATGGSGTPGGGPGSIQFDNAGLFGGFVASGDATINTANGVVTVVSTQGLPFAPSATIDALFNPTGVKTANYTAIANDFVPVDCSTGSVQVALPASPPDKTIVGVKLVAVIGANDCVVTTSGGATLNSATGPMTMTLVAKNQCAYLQYYAAGSIWYVIAADNSSGGYTAGSNVTITTSGGTRIISSVGGIPGGTTGQIQYDNAGAFGGFTMSGDATLVPSTGIITVTATNGVSFAPSATTDTTNASNISSGTIPAARIGSTSITYDRIQNVGASSLLGNPTGTGRFPEEITLGSNLAFSGTVLNATGGTGSPGGSAGQIEFNNAGAFGGFTMSGDATLVTSTGVITVTKTNGVAFAASATTDTTNAVNISSGLLQAARLPHPSASTLGGVQSYAGVPHQWINAISTSGVPSSTQPAFVDISGTVAASQLPNPTATTLGGIESYIGVAHQWINAISTSGVPSSTQPAFTDISGTLAASQLPNPSATTLGGIESYIAVPSQWINAISTSGVPSSTQPAFTDISGTITTAQIGASQVTYATIQNEAASTLLGNPTGSPAAPSEIGLSSGFGFSGSTLYQVGGLVTVATHAARNAIPNALRLEGMIAYTQNTTGTDGLAGYWELLPAPWTGVDADWTSAGPLGYMHGGSLVTSRGNINLIDGASIIWTVADDSGLSACDVTPALAAGGVGTASLAASSVTYAKIQNATAHTLLGNPTGSGAAPSEITLGTNLAFSGSVLNATGGSGSPGGSANQVQWNNAGGFGGFTMSGDVTLVTSTGVATIANSAVTLAKMANFAASSLMGNPTGSPTAPGAITLGANLSFSGTTLVASGSGTPGGSSGQLQTNSSGSFGGLATTLWTSATLGAGSAVVAQGSTTYGSDQTAALQTLLTAAAGGILVIDGQYGILGTLAIPSNTTVIFPKGCGLISLIGRTAGPLMVNSGFQSAGTINAATRGVGGANSATPGLSTPATLSAVGSFRNTNIKIIGGIFNCNGQNLTAGTKSDTLYSLWTALQFWGVDGLTIEDTTIFDSPNYGIWGANVRNVRIHNPAFRQDNQIIYGTDNIHINGPAQYISITNALTHCYDDNIAFNADDGFTAVTPNYPWAGPITDVQINGWQVVPIASGSNGGRGIRLLSNTQRIDRVTVEGVRGVFGAYAGILTPNYNFVATPAQEDQTFGYGNYGSITFRNWQYSVNLLASTGGDAGLQGDFSIDGQGGIWIFDGIRKISPATAQPMFYVDSRYSNNSHESYNFTNCEYYEGATSANAAPMITLNGRAKYMKVHNCRSTRAARLTQADSPIVKVAAGNSTLPADEIILESCYTSNVNSMVEVAAGRVGLLQVAGYHHNSNTHYGITISSGVVVDNLDQTGLKTDANGGVTYSNSGTITNVVGVSGGTFGVRPGIANLQDGLLTYYRFSEVAGTSGAGSIKDQLGAGNLTPHAAVANGATFGGLVTAQFSGSQWYFSPDTGTNNPRLMNCANQIAPYTVMGWVNLATPGTQQCVFSRGNGTGARNWGYILTNTSAQYFAEAGGTATAVTSGTTITTGTWHHVALVADPFSYIGSSPLMYLYLDGSLVGSTAYQVPTAPLQTDPLVFGSLQNSSSFPVLSGGLMLGMGVWAVALNAYQIGLAYNGGTPVYVI